MRRSKTSIVWFVIYVIITFCTVLLWIANNEGDYNFLAAVFTLLLSFSSVVLVRGSWYLLAIYGCIAYSNYSICFANYLSHINSYFVGYSTTEIGAKGLNILMAFAALLFLIAPKNTIINPDVEKTITKNNKENAMIVIVLAVVLAFVWFYGFTRPDVVGQRGSPSALYEYSIIFIIIGLYYSGRRKIYVGLFVGIAFAYALQNFMYGGRITGLQLIICLTLCLLIDKLTLKKVIPIGVALLLLMSAIGQFRASLVLSGGTFSNVWDLLTENGFALDTAYSSYYTSMTFIDMLGNIDWTQRIDLFFRWVLSIFAGGSVTNSNLAEYTRQFYMHYNGGVLPYFAYFYLGIAGVVLIAAYLRFVFDKVAKANDESTGFMRCFTIYISCTTFRWYLYSPSQLFRGVLLLAVTFFLLHIVNNMMENGDMRIRMKRRRKKSTV